MTSNDFLQRSSQFFQWFSFFLESKSLFLSSCELIVHCHHWGTEWIGQDSLMSCLRVKLPPSLYSCALLSLWDLNSPTRDQTHAWNCRALTTGPNGRQWQPTLVHLPGKSHGRRSLVGCSPWGCKESDTTERLHFHFLLSCIGEGNGNPLQCSCLENPRDRGAWWAAVYGVAQSRTRMKWLSSSSNHWATRVFPLLKSSVTLLCVPRPTSPSQPRLDLSKKEIPLGSFIDTSSPTPCPLHILM